MPYAFNDYMCGTCALQHCVTGQGLLLRQEDLGASNKPASQKILQIYMNHLAKAKKIQRYIKTAQTSCRMKTASLCGWDVSEEDSRDVLSILASPDAYDARLPEHTGKVTFLLRTCCTHVLCVAATGNVPLLQRGT
jgi:hypothetical protein